MVLVEALSDRKTLLVTASHHASTCEQWWAYINGGLLPEKTASTEFRRFRVPLELLPDAAAALPLSI